VSATPQWLIAQSSVRLAVPVKSATRHPHPPGTPLGLASKV